MDADGYRGPLGVDSTTVDPVEIARIRELVLSHLRRLGFDVSACGGLDLRDASKSGIRAVYAAETEANVLALRESIGCDEARFMSQLAQRRPHATSVRPVLQMFDRHSPEADLFRWIVAHWSVPVSQGYGRRMRFLVRDENNDGAVIGVIGLTDPVFSLAARDKWLGWDAGVRRTRLAGVMEAFALGAVPPYDSMLGGKLIAMLCASQEVKDAFRHRYEGVVARISGRRHDGLLCAVTTQSAFGRSSLYNRLRRPDGKHIWRPIGYTSGSGDGHIFGEAYAALKTLDRRVREDADIALSSGWKATGARNKKDVLFTALPLIGLDPRRIRQHGIQREAYIAPLDACCMPEDEAEGFVPLSVEEATLWWCARWGERASAVRRASSAESWSMFGKFDARC